MYYQIKISAKISIIDAAFSRRLESNCDDSNQYCCSTALLLTVFVMTFIMTSFAFMHMHLITGIRVETIIMIIVI